MLHGNGAAIFLIRVHAGLWGRKGTQGVTGAHPGRCPTWRGVPPGVVSVV